MTSPLLRALREEDAEQVAALFADAFGTARKLDAHEVASWLRDPAVSSENLRVLEEDGRIVGYCDVASQPRESLTMEIGFDEPPRDGDFGSLALRTYRDDDRDELAGFALGYRDFGAEADLGRINWLGVRKPWRRRGLAEALLRRSFAEL